MLIVLIMGLITRAGGHIARMMWTRALYRGAKRRRVEENDEISLDELKKNKMSKTKAGFHLKA